MKLDLIPFNPISVPPDLLLALKNPRPVLIAGGILLALIAAWLLFVPRNRKARVAQLGGLTWKRNQFCRGWLITGDTGSGKTSSGINQLAHQVFQNEPTWGGLCIDEKGVYWETLAAMARHYGRERDLIHLQIRRTTRTHSGNRRTAITLPATAASLSPPTPSLSWTLLRVSVRAGTKVFSKARRRRTSPTR